MAEGHAVTQDPSVTRSLGGQVLPEGSTWLVPIGASPWGPAGRRGEPGHGQTRSTMRHRELAGTGTHSESALQLTIMNNQPWLCFLYKVSSLCLLGFFVHSRVSGSRVAQERVPTLAPGSGCILRAAGLCQPGKGPTPWQHQGSAGPGHPVAPCQSIPPAAAMHRVRGIPQPPTKFRGAQGSCWACAWRRQESDCRLSHRRLSAPSEQ